MKKIDFTFLITCYNQQEYIIQALESVKYQIQQYGKGKNFQIIVGDDGSDDGSVCIIEKWIKENREVCIDISTIFLNANSGTCAIVARLMRSVKGTHFFLLNGDDIIACNNIFEKYSLLDEYDIVCNSVLKFNQSGVIKKANCYYNVSAQKFKINSWLKWCAFQGVPFENGAILRKELFTEDVLQFMEKFVLIDDRSRNAKIVNDNANLKIYYDDEPIILYRITENSVSNVLSKNRKIVLQESICLLKQELNWVNNIFFRLCIKARAKSYEYELSEKTIMKLGKYANAYYFSMGILVAVHLGELIMNNRRLIANYAEANDVFYKEISDCCIEYRF